MSRRLRVGVSPWSKLDHHCLGVHDKNCDAGTELEILQTVATALNLSLEFRVTNVRGCGKPVNNSWTGLCGMLMADEIDITGNLCDFETKGRQEAFGFSAPVWQYSNAFLLKAPDFNASFNPTGPFSTKSWYLIGVCVLVWYLFIVFYYCYFIKLTLTGSIYQAANKLLNITVFSEDVRSTTAFWIIWIAYVGCILAFYNNYIIRAIMASYPIVRPFNDGYEFAKAAAEGKYYLLDYRNPPDTTTCFGQMCTDLNLAVRRGHYVYTENSSGYALLDLIASDERLVLMKGQTFLETYLSDYPDRDRLWLVADDAISESRSVYLWQKGGFPYENEFNDVLWNLAEFKTYARLRRTRQIGAKKVRTGNRIVARFKEGTAFRIVDIFGPLQCLSVGCFLSCVAFVLEVCFFKRCYYVLHK